MNILFFFTSPINPTKGGVQRTTWNLAKELHDKGNTVAFLSFLKEDTHYQDPFIRTYLPNSLSLSSCDNKKWLVNFVVENKIDIIINQKGILKEALTLLEDTKCKTGVKLVSCIHNSIFGGVRNFSSIHQKTFSKRHMEYLMPIFNNKIVTQLMCILYVIRNCFFYSRLCSKSDVVVLLSKTMNKELKKMIFFRSVNNIIIIPNGIPLPTIVEDDVRKKTVLYVGRIDFEYKRSHFLIPIWKEYNLLDKESHLLIVGDGYDRPELEKRAISERLLNINFLGFSNPEEYYRQSMCLLLTSCTESFGMVVIEAMSYGVVPLCYNSFPEISEIIEDGKDGFLVQDGDSKKMANILFNLIETPQLMCKMRENALAKAGNYDIKKISNNWKEMLENL